MSNNKKVLRIVAVLIAAGVCSALAESNASDKSDDINYVCAKERERLGAQFDASKKEQAAYLSQYSVESLMKDPAIMQAAKDSQLAVLCGGQKVPNAPGIVGPGNIISQEALYNYYAKKLATAQSNIYKEIVRLKSDSVAFAYKEALTLLEEDCEQKQELLRDKLAREAQEEQEQREIKARESAFEKQERDLKELVDRTKQIIELKDGMTQHAEDDEAQMRALRDKIDLETKPSGGVVVKPGRFDAQRQQSGMSSSAKRLMKSASRQRVDSILAISKKNSADSSEVNK